MILSIALIVVLGLLANRLFTWLKLPGLLGMILVGVAVGPYGLNWLDASVLENATDIRLIALIVILLRAGLGLEKHLLKSVGSVAIKMSAIPCLLEGFTIMGVSRLVLGLSWVEAGMLGFIVAAVSPAVIVPAMLQLKEQGWGMRRGVPVIVLAGASVDDVFAITLFTAFLGMATQAGGSPVGQIARIPVQIVGGILLGAVVGWGLAVLFRRVHVSHLEGVGITLAGAFVTLIIGEYLGVASLLGVMALGFLLLEKAAHRSARLEHSLNTVWFFAQIFLFVLIGAEVDVTLAWQAGLSGLVIIGAGLLARSLGVTLALLGSPLTRQERLFAAIAYMPKATVQAAIGGIPLAMGIASGGTMLAIAVLAVVITASLGAVAIKVSAPRLLERESDGSGPPAGPAGVSESAPGRHLHRGEG
jgi:solute carrier family 9B (sodium/hydrogen exchanger), member 1/2